LYGYRVGEVNLPLLPEKKKGSIVDEARPELPTDIRQPVAVSAGIHCDYVCPHPDMHHTPTARSGAMKRVVIKPPDASPDLLSEFKIFVKEFVEREFVPLSPDIDLSVETWLNGTNYPLWRREQLLKEALNLREIGDDRLDYICKSFIKDEFYNEFKHARTINSRSDRFKVAVGPIFKAIEKVVFSRPEFIKKVPVADRPEYILKKLYMEGGFYIATDYSSFEALFTPALMESCEFVLYEHMTKHLARGDWFMGVCREVLGGVNECHFKKFLVRVPGTRMSGEMCTSLGNGFSNLMIMMFVCHKLGKKCNGVVEGDDGLFVFDSWHETDLFLKLGLTIKLDVHHSLNTASFCGIIFDQNDKNNICDVRDVVSTMSWLNSRYSRSKKTKKLSLLRCKALSFAHQYPGCPVIQSMAHSILRLTSGMDVRHLLLSSAANEYEREAFSSFLGNPVPHRPVGIGTRLLVEKLYKISVNQQLILENWFESQTEIRPIPEALVYNFPACWLQFGVGYKRDVLFKNPVFPMPNPKLTGAPK
jgi:hypothetical protein